MGCGISTQQQHQQHQQHRPKSCDVPGINIYLASGREWRRDSFGIQSRCSGWASSGGRGDRVLEAFRHLPWAMAIRDRLPDLTSLHFPPPLATPLDPSEELAHQQQGASPGPPSLPPLHPGSPGSPPWCWDPAVACTGPAGSSLPRWAHPPGKYVHTPPLHRRHQRPHPPRITVEGLTMDTNALSLDGYGGPRPESRISSGLSPPHHLPYPNDPPHLGS
ncbi:hypothetical protein MRX96_027180 [Rhipicephalus microplus]